MSKVRITHNSCYFLVFKLVYNPKVPASIEWGLYNKHLWITRLTQYLPITNSPSQQIFVEKLWHSKFQISGTQTHALVHTFSEPLTIYWLCFNKEKSVPISFQIANYTYIIRPRRWQDILSFYIKGYLLSKFQLSLTLLFQIQIHSNFLTIFAKKLHLRCLTGSWMFSCYPPLIMFVRAQSTKG